MASRLQSYITSKFPQKIRWLQAKVDEQKEPRDMAHAVPKVILILHYV